MIMTPEAPSEEIDLEQGERQWRKSSFSGAVGNCVEIALPGEEALIRDSKNIQGGMLHLSANMFDLMLQNLPETNNA